MAQDCPKCPAGLPPWLATFADLMSLLMCFFVLLLSFATMDATRFKKMAESMQDAFGVQREIPANEIVMGTSVIKQEFSPSMIPEPSLVDEIRQQTTDVEGMNLETPEAAKEKDKDKEQDKEKDKDKDKDYDQQSEQVDVDEALAQEAMAQQIAQELRQQAAELQISLKDEIAEGLVSVETEESKIIVRIREKGSFPSGQAALNPGFFDVIDRISTALGRSPGQIVVAGHTDDIPISTARYRSNWELSAARAVTVVHALLQNKEISPVNVLVEGHAESNPLVPNDTVENRATNRRVELILIRGQDQESSEELTY